MAVRKRSLLTDEETAIILARKQIPFKKGGDSSSPSAVPFVSKSAQAPKEGRKNGGPSQEANK